MINLKKILSKEIVSYIIVIILCGFFLTWIMQLWSADLTIPFAYNGDAILTGTGIKGAIDNGWYLSNHFIGAPYGLTLYDFPPSGTLDLLVMKTISLLFPNWAITMNLYFLFTFPLVAITAFFVFRKLGISRMISLAGSLLFTFMPFHFLRGEAHLTLSAYYMIPLIVLVCLWLFEDGFSLMLWQKTNSDSKLKINWKAAGSILICIFAGLAFIYYSFFACFFLLIAGIGAALSRKKWQPLLISGTLIVIVILTVMVCNIPSLLYQFQNGTNQLLTRNPQDSETYGLKIIQLLLPINGNSIPFLANFAGNYNITAPLVNENVTASLGIIGSIGFLGLLGTIFYRVFRPGPVGQKNNFEKLWQVSVLNGAAVLLGTIGGLGSFIAYLFFPQIRAYNRISIFIAFFSLLAVAWGIEYIIKKMSFSKIVGILLVAAILIFGITDQTTSNFIPDYQNTKSEFLNDQNFVTNIEKQYPIDRMVFQLPYVPFPESPPLNKMASYDLFRGYLHSTKIEWSYGTMVGRWGDSWESYVSSLPTDQMLKQISISGFDGIYVDSYGYSDNGEEIVASLTYLLNVKPLVSENGRLYFFNMGPYNSGQGNYE